MNRVQVKDLIIDNDKPFTLIAGLNVLESKEITEQVISECVKVSKELGIPIFLKLLMTKLIDLL